MIFSSINTIGRTTISNIFLVCFYFLFDIEAKLSCRKPFCINKTQQISSIQFYSTLSKVPDENSLQEINFQTSLKIFYLQLSQQLAEKFAKY